MLFDEREALLRFDAAELLRFDADEPLLREALELFAFAAVVRRELVLFLFVLEPLRERPPLVDALRSAAGISALTTAFVRLGIRRSRKPAIFSSSRRIWRASLAVSLSPTDSASASIAV